MGKVDSWVTKITRLKNSKVARFSYKAEAYANDDIEGVENYDYSRDMNIPLATHTDFDPDVLSIGARAQFSSVTKNGLNHFFGRVSYNLNKVIDFLDDFLTDFISLDDRFTSFTEIITFNSSATLANYANGTTKRLLNTSVSTITITLPAGETYLGSNKITLTPSVMLTLTKRGTVWVNSSGNAITADKWKTSRNITITDADGTNTGAAVSVDGSENETLKLPPTIKANLTGNASTATLATLANEIKPLGNSITLPATSTSVTKIIKIATVSDYYTGTFNIICSGNNLRTVVKVYINGGDSRDSGVRVVYSKIGTSYGIKKIVVTSDTSAWDSSRQIYAEILTFANATNTTTLGVVETNAGTFTPSMTEVSSVEGTVVDSLPLDYQRGDISSYQHEFTKNIIGNLTGNADTATNATNATKANVRVSLRHGTTFFEKTWNGFTDFNGYYIWTDGANIYYSHTGTNQYVLNKTTSTWLEKTWNGVTNLNGYHTWTDGENIYYSLGTAQYVLNKATSTWTPKTWYGFTDFNGSSIWTDGDDIYYSGGTAQYVLNKATSTWTPKTWYGLTNFNGADIWTDGDVIYYSYAGNQYVLNKATSTWTPKTWYGLTYFDGAHTWTDGDVIYYSYDGTNRVLNKSTSTWSSKTWSGLTNFEGRYVWIDGDAIYYNNNTIRYVLPATRHNYVDENKYQGLFGVSTSCRLKTLSARFVFSNE